jgi:RNA polymerase sigma factor (sigma-70 family)
MHEASRTIEPPLAAGTNDDFGEFYRREYDRAVRLAWLLTGSETAAEDVVQDAMTAVYRTFSRVTTPSAYLRRAVINTSGNLQRNERRQADRSVMLAERWQPALEPADAQLFELVANLPYRERVVIVGRYWGGWSEADIAAALQCRPGTVKSLASRALHRLRNEVQP